MEAELFYVSFDKFVSCKRQGDAKGELRIELAHHSFLDKYFASDQNEVTA